MNYLEFFLSIKFLKLFISIKNNTTILRKYFDNKISNRNGAKELQDKSL